MQHTSGKEQTASSATPQVAIIVPIYNVVTYLSRCLDSLVAQTIPIELVLVDDGSTDASGAIADWYASKYDFVHVIHQANAGQGAARNIGLAASSAPFVAFVDSDDYVAPTYAEKLLSAIRSCQADIAVCMYTMIVESGLRLRAFSPRLLPAALTGAKALHLSLRDFSIKSYTWNKLFRRTLFTDRNITFPSIMFEDMATMPRLFSRARRVGVVKQSLYFYCRRKGSLMRAYTPKRITDNITALAMVRDYLIETGQFRQYRFSYTFMVHKFAITMMMDAFYMHFKHHLPRMFHAGWEAYRHTLQLSEPTVDPMATIEALVRRQAYQMVEK